jgi:hypothetical protein
MATTECLSLSPNFYREVALSPAFLFSFVGESVRFRLVILPYSLVILIRTS